MKKIINKTKISLALILLFSISSCETDFPNPNSPSSDFVLNTKDGLNTLVVGIRQLYSTTGVRFIVETPAVTSREAAITTTFQNMIELEDGGADLPNFNSNVRGIWSTLIRVISMSNDLVDNAQVVELGAGSRSGMMAFGKIFKALSIGHLAINYVSVIDEPTTEGQAEFISSNDGILKAIVLLEEAKSILIATPPSDDFTSTILLGKIDLMNVANAYLARFYLLSGNYVSAITSADLVDQSSASYFTYDTQNPNPIWARVNMPGSNNFKPRDNFGLPASFVFDPNDERFDFYFSDTTLQTNQNGFIIRELGGFFTAESGDIPIYIPSEMTLIKAEAFARTMDLVTAEAELNNILTKNPGDDVLGIGANVAPYSGVQTQEALLDAIYQNRRAELLLIGMGLEDSRRFGRPQPSGTASVFAEERNRNYYPFPDRERSNNSNTPTDPSI